MKYSALTPEVSKKGWSGTWSPQVALIPLSLLQLLAMTRELEELGGGDARVGRAAVCVVASAITGCQTILQTSASGLTVQDPRSCYTSNGSKGSKSFPLLNFQANHNISILDGTLAQVFAKA